MQRLAEVLLDACRFAGVTDALCVWRCVEFFVHDPQILVRAWNRSLHALSRPKASS